MAKKQAGAKGTGILTSTAAIKRNPPSDDVVDDNLNASDDGGAIEVGGPTPSKPFKAMGELDEFGFGAKTETSFVIAMLEDGSFTKPQIIDAFVKQFANGDFSAQNAKRKKSSLSVIFSDMAKPFGTYHASRSLIVVKNETTGVMNLDPIRVDTIKKAIAGGILQSLKGFNMKKHPDKVKVVLRKFGLPTE